MIFKPKQPKKMCQFHLGPLWHTRICRPIFAAVKYTGNKTGLTLSDGTMIQKGISY